MILKEFHTPYHYLGSPHDHWPGQSASPPAHICTMKAEIVLFIIFSPVWIISAITLFAIHKDYQEKFIEALVVLIVIMSIVCILGIRSVYLDMEKKVT